MTFDLAALQTCLNYNMIFEIVLMNLIGYFIDKCYIILYYLLFHLTLLILYYLIIVIL